MTIIGYDASGRPIRQQEQRPSSGRVIGYDAWGREVRESLDGGTAFLRGLGDSLSLSFGDELMGVGAGASAALSGGNFRSAYDRQVAQSRDNLEQARQERPLSTGAGELAGFLVPGIGWGRAARVGLNVGGRLGVAAGVGGALGAVSGAGTGENVDERLQGALMGGAFGAALGGGAQAVLGEAAPALLRAGRRAVGLPSQPGRMGVAERAAEDLTRLARQGNSTVQSFNDIAPLLSGAAQRDPTLTVAEALGRPAINTVARYSRLPGRTSTRAEEILEHNAETFDDLVSRLDDRLTPRADDGAPLAMRDASGELDALFTRTSLEGYQPALSRPINTQLAGEMQQVIRNHPEFYQRAIQEALKIARGEGIQGFTGITDPRLWHYLKVGASDTLRSMKREGLGQTLARQYTQSIRRLVDRLDQVPGYRSARERWGSLSEAREALDAGFNFDRMRPADMEALAARLTPFQRRYLQSGVSERIRDVLERRDNDGLVNIARELTNRRRSGLMRRAFGDKPGEIDAFIEFARTRRQMHADAVRMASSQNSVTGLVTGEMPNIPLTKAGLIDQGAQAAWNATIGRIGERNRDLMGRILLTPVGEFERAGRGLLSRAQRESRRRANRTRLERTRGAYLAGLGGMGVYDVTQE